MSYRRNVESAAMALARGEDANWELARLTFENTRNASDLNEPGKVTMEQWCADVRESSGRQFVAGTGKQYKRVWSRFGGIPEEPRPSWSEVWDSALGNSPESREESRFRSAINRATPEQKRETFYRLSQDEDVVNRETVNEVFDTIHTRTREVRGMPPVPPINREQVDARIYDNRAGMAHATASAQLDVYTAESITAAKKYRETLQTMGLLAESLRDAEADGLRYLIGLWESNLDTLIGGSTVDAVDAFLKGSRQ